ncbi:MAG: type II/IV secretion system protein [Deltaproteobacteria bacterium]|nr:type II/IV secretion system protein [Deltaproteobacteria bacterium]
MPLPEPGPGDRQASPWPGTLDLATLLDVLENQGVLRRAQVVEVLPAGERRRRVLDRQRQLDQGDEGVPVSAAEVLASFGLVGADDGTAVSELRIGQTLAKAAGMKLQRIDALRLDAKLITASVSRAYARRNCALPLGIEGGKLVVAVDSPLSRDVADTLAARTGQPVELVLGLRSEIIPAIDDTFHFRATLRGAAADLGEPLTDLGNLEQLVKLGQTGREVEGDDRHVVRAVDFLLRYALDQGASDIHLEPKREQALVRLRIDGVLHTVHQLPKLVFAAISSRIKTMARLDIADKRRPQDGRVKLQHQRPQGGDREVELRASTMPTAFGEKIVLRIFDPEVLLQDLPGLGLFPRDLEHVQKMIHRPHGLVLVCGPTGSGKTTTLYSCLRAIASPQLNIATIEDPIEMVIEAYNQTALQPKVGLTFAGALRTLLRQDPDVIMVGEIRDAETAHNAIQAAMTGHLVLSTVHTNDAPSTVARLVDLGVQPYLLSASLLGVVAQRLVRTVCLQCREETVLSSEQALALGLELSGEQFAVWQGRGCAVCRDTGLKGRTGVYEVMPMSEKLRRMIAESADAGRITRQAVEEGMVTLREAALKKMALGLTTFDEVLRVTADIDS